MDRGLSAVVFAWFRRRPMCPAEGRRIGRLRSIPSLLLMTAFTWVVVLPGGAATLSPDGSQVAPSTPLFTATSYTLQDIGGPATPSEIDTSGEDILIVSSATGVDDTSDQISFASQPATGDFDVRVRVVSIDLTDPWAGAGLMARDGPSPSAMFAAVFATPGPAGCYFHSRNAIGEYAVRTGFFPANYPYTWLRLQRTGNVFTGYAGIDGNAWTRVGAAAVSTMPATVQIGLVAASGDESLATRVRFRGVGDVVSPVLTTLVDLALEPMGPSSRNTGLVISELMYHPRDVLSSNSLEFVELHNPEGVFSDLSGYSLDGDIEYTFPPDTILPAGDYLVVARYPSEVEAAYGLTNVAGPFTGNLPNDEGTVRLVNELGGVLLEVDYETRLPWPAAADGTGHSLVLRRPSYGERDPRAWGLSDVLNGSPGRGDGTTSDPLKNLCINEFVAHTDDPLLDQVELFNRGSTTLDLSGVILSDRPGEDRFVVPQGVTLSAGGFLLYTQTQLGFAFDAAGGWIVLKNPEGTRVLDAVQYDGQRNGVSTGRYPDGNSAFGPLLIRTFGSHNTRFDVSPVGINELMAHPISGDDDDQYVELHNASGSPIDLSGWAFVDGIDYELPPTTTISAGGYIVVARNRERFLSRYPGVSPALVTGDFGGRLSHRGERVALAMPDDLVEVDDLGNPISTNTMYTVVDEVTYELGGRWGRWADGGGSSLELIDPDADKRLAPNWADSDESAKAPWTLVASTGVMDHGQGTPNRFEMILLGAGECRVDAVECRQNGGANRIANPGFDGNTDGWVAQGTHHRTVGTSAESYDGSGSLHVIASARGDTGANRIRTAISALDTGQTLTLRAQARWLKGDPHLLLRVRGNWLEASGVLTVPTNLGTPGEPNSRLVANAPPAVVDVIHAPVLPAAGEPVRVTARVEDPDGVGSVTLTYRLDPGGGSTGIAMSDVGAGADVRAADGIYSALIPGQLAGARIAFTIQAQDVPGMTAQFPDHSATAEGLIQFGEAVLSGSLGTYHVWCTQDTLDTWAQREKNSNDPLECTFVYGQSRVIYGAGILYSGSPFHTPNYTGPLGFACDYEMAFPPDDLFLGTDDFVLLVQNPRVNHFFLPDPTAQAEATAYWIGRKLGQIYNHKRWVHLYLNGNRRLFIYEDTQQPNADLLDVYFPDHPEAQLLKIEDWFEFDDGGAGFSYVTARLQPYTTSGGQKKPARYRWNWRPRAGADPNEFNSLFSLVDVHQAATPEPYTSRVEGLSDVHSWLSCIAVHHIVGDWDSYGYRRGKNMFAYRPGGGRWRLLLWDMDFALGAANTDGPTHDLFDTSGEGDPAIAAMFNHPPFRREYLAILQDAADGPLAPGAADPLLDARFEMLRDHSIPVQDPFSIKNYISQRRDYILSQIPSATFAVDGPTTVAIPGNLLTLSGSAPMDARTLLVNGVAYPVTWTGVTEWTIQVPMASGTQNVVVQAFDRDGVLLSGAGTSLTVTSSEPPADPEDWIVLNEIMHHPANPGAAFVEVYNHHPTSVFDLSAWRLNGLDYTFPPGAWIPAGGFHVVAEERFAYADAYGPLTPMTDAYGGRLDPDGETLTLFRPGPVAGSELVVDRVRYEAAPPWPAGASQPGTSLQLVDAEQDNSRVGNWAVGGAPAAPQWKKATAIGTASSSTLYIYLTTAGDVHIDDVALVEGTQPDVGPNLLANGDFESVLSGPWAVAPNHAASTITTAERHAGLSSLHVVASSGGSSSGTSISQIISAALNIGQPYALSFWYRESTNGGPLVVRLSGSGIVASVDPAPPSTLAADATPDAINSVAGTRDPFPPVWLNELQPVQTSGPTNVAGDHVPWIELLQTSAAPIPLDGLYLSLDPAAPLAEPFPPSSTLAAGEYRILFADGRTDLDSPGEWHTAFALPLDTGIVVLARIGADGPEIVDYLSYGSVPLDYTYGDVPDAQPFYRQIMFRATPGASNSGSVPPLEVVITEWMADNSGAYGLVDPVDGDADDWFELYNKGATGAELGGYYLTDDLDNPLKFLIPLGYSIPPDGYLLVWADDEAGQNHPAVPQLHVGFKLSADGEAIGLFAPDRTPIDTVVFGAQTEDVSEGPLPEPDGPVTALAPTPGGPNYITLPSTAPYIIEMEPMPGPGLVIRYLIFPGAVYRVESALEPDDGSPVPLTLDRMAFGDERTDIVVLPADPHRIFFIRRVR